MTGNPTRPWIDRSSCHGIGPDYPNQWRQDQFVQKKGAITFLRAIQNSIIKAGAAGSWRLRESTLDYYV
jgi:hypothetical protein